MKLPPPLRELSPRMWQSSLLALVLVRLAMSVLLLFDIPKLPSHEGWYFRHGGDATLYAELAGGIVSGHPKPTTVGAGLPLLMAGLSRMTGGETYYDFLPWLVPMNGFLLAGLSVWIVAQTAFYLTGSRHQALLAAVLWVISGYVLWLGLGLHPDAENLRDAYLPRQMWTNGLTDPPSLFLAMLGIALAVWAYSRQSKYAWVGYALSGVCFGLGCVFRIHVLPIAAVVVAALFWTRQWRAALWVIAGMLIGFAPQFWHNTVTNRHPLNTPYLDGWIYFNPDNIAGRIRDGWRIIGPNHEFAFRLNGAPFSPWFLRDSIVVVTRGNWAVAVAEFAIAAFVLYAFVRCWQQRGSFAALVMFGAPAASLALHVSTFVFVGDPIRFSLPAISVGIPAIVWVADTASAVTQTLVGKLRLRRVPAES